MNLIEELGQLLDKDMPGWFNKINLDKLNMHEPKNCILGQVYGDYFDGKMKLLKNDAQYINITCSNTHLKQWKTYVQKRIKENKMASDWNWACQQMLNGKKVFRLDWKHKSDVLYWYTPIPSNNYSAIKWYDQNGKTGIVELAVGCIQATDWQLYKTTLVDLRPGDVFELPTKLAKYKLTTGVPDDPNCWVYDLDSGCNLFSMSKDSEVIKC